jgi:hypothetical protein
MVYVLAVTILLACFLFSFVLGVVHFALQIADIIMECLSCHPRHRRITDDRNSLILSYRQRMVNRAWRCMWCFFVSEIMLIILYILLSQL